MSALVNTSGSLSAATKLYNRVRLRKSIKSTYE